MRLLISALARRVIDRRQSWNQSSGWAPIATKMRAGLQSSCYGTVMWAPCGSGVRPTMSVSCAGGKRVWVRE
jgi:hypothetical protein